MQMHRLVATAVDLPPPRHARQNGEATALPGFVLCGEMGHFRTGTHKTHRASQNIEKLRKLIDAEPAKDAAHTRDTWIIPGFVNEVPIRIPPLHLILQLLRVFHHGPEFIDLEQVSISAHPFLTKNDWPAII